MLTNILNSNYADWAPLAIDKILKCIKTSTTLMHIETCQKMINQFILVTVVNTSINEEEIIRTCSMLHALIENKKAQIKL